MGVKDEVGEGGDEGSGQEADLAVAVGLLAQFVKERDDGRPDQGVGDPADQVEARGVGEEEELEVGRGGEETRQLAGDKIENIEAEEEVHTEGRVVEVVGVEVAEAEGEGVVDDPPLVGIVAVGEAVGDAPEVEEDREEDQDGQERAGRFFHFQFHKNPSQSAVVKRALRNASSHSRLSGFG